MIATVNGTIKAVISTSMVQKDGAWKPLLVCRVPLDSDDETLKALFNTSMVEDTTNNREYHNTKFLKIAKDDNFKYVWLTYMKVSSVDAKYLEALSILGVQTQIDENGVTESVQA